MLGMSRKRSEPANARRKERRNERKKERNTRKGRDAKTSGKSQKTRGKRAREEIRDIESFPVERRRSVRDDGPPLKMEKSSMKHVSGDKPRITPEDVIRNNQRRNRK